MNKKFLLGITFLCAMNVGFVFGCGDYDIGFTQKDYHNPHEDYEERQELMDCIEEKDLRNVIH